MSERKTTPDRKPADKDDRKSRVERERAGHRQDEAPNPERPGNRDPQFDPSHIQQG